MKAKAILLTLLLSLSAVSLWAQEKYEYAEVSITNVIGTKGKMLISKANSYEEIEFKVEQGSAGINRSAFLAYIEKLQTEGWEVYQVTPGTSILYVTYYLRKKKN